MEKSIGIIICNYNKQDYIVNCIQSILDSSIKNIDIYVVDNASTDNSVMCIKEAFGETIRLLVNSDNLGGSGGFNTGLREVLKYNYKYVMLMDNDIIADKDAVEELYCFMEDHPDTGIVGSKVYFMDYPDRIWGYGGVIDFDNYVQVDQYKNCVDGEGIPEVSYCDYVAACSLMARVDAIRKVGLMPENNFIYWDDMEWGYRFNQEGYKVAAWGGSKIWHKGGGRNAGNTFIHYYMWRNRIRFFLNVLPNEKKEYFAETVLSEMFRMIYSVNLKGEKNIIKTVMHAFDDAVHGVSGRATEGKILPRNLVVNRVQLALKNAKNVVIKFNGNFEGLGNIIRNIRGFDHDMKITIAIDEKSINNLHHQPGATLAMMQKVKEQHTDCYVVDNYKNELYESNLVMCEHIFKLTKDMPKDVYIDSWCNIIYGPDDFIYASSFEQTKELFLICYKQLLLKNIEGE